MKRFFYSISVLTLFLHACQREIPFEELPQYTPRLVVNAELNNEGLASMQVSSSAFAYDSESPQYVSDLDLRFFENGTEIPLVYDSFFKRHSSAIVPKPGAVYSISGGKRGFPSISSTARTPDVLRNKVVTYVIDGGIDRSGNTSDLLKVAFDDDPGSTNYYKINFFYFSETLNEYLGFDFATDDPSINALDAVETDDGGFVVSDRLFNGERKEFQAVPPAGLVFNNSDILYLIQVRNLSEEYYRYYTSLSKFKENMADAQGILQSGIVVYSNVNGGLGIFAGTYLESDTIR